METSELIKKRIMNEDGRIIRWPKKQAEQSAVLAYIAHYFAADVRYSEKDVNELILQHIVFADYALLRRELFEKGYLDRTSDCREYRRGNYGIRDIGTAN